MRKGIGGVLAALLVIIIFIIIALFIFFLYGKVHGKTFDLINEMGKVLQGGG
ncbi:MAG: hypothetical protein J7K87_03330 [Candidatus Aenigmarchaeota archaeon]|nr:hypothetical protein [Candidatus Aenigmarchaeota archaeon]